MSKTKGKAPTNKQRDAAISKLDNAMRQMVPFTQQLSNRIDDIFAVFSMFVEYTKNDKGFGKFVEKKVEEGKKQQEEQANAEAKDKQPVAETTK